VRDQGDAEVLLRHKTQRLPGFVGMLNRNISETSEHPENILEKVVFYLINKEGI
jgi:hypothetical protein